MHSVLSPVGPERPSVYWIRRGVIIVVLLAIVLLLVHAFAGGSPSAGAGDTPGPSGSPQPSVTSSTSTPRCGSSDLSAVLATDKTEYASGEQATFTGTFTNTSGTPCRLHSTVASRDWTITSGHDTIWTTSGCPHTGAPTTAKLTATKTATVSISWDVHRNDSSCTTGASALPGTYVLKATFGAVTAKPVVFHVVS